MMNAHSAAMIGSKSKTIPGQVMKIMGIPASASKWMG
jgi:hypothetical protein